MSIYLLQVLGACLLGLHVYLSIADNGACILGPHVYLSITGIGCMSIRPTCIFIYYRYWVHVY